MGSKKSSTQSKKSADAPKANSLVLPVLAILVASVPLYFFRDPFQLHDAGLLKGFYGIAIWPSSILAGYAFYRSVAFTKTTAKPLIEDITQRTVATIAVIVAVVMVLAQLFRSDYVGMAAMRPWDQLMIAIPMFGSLRFLETFFFQGMWQDKAVAEKSRPLRVVFTILAALVVHLGFILAIGESGFLFFPEQLYGYVGVVMLGTGAIALLYEFGWALYLCAIVNLLFGAGLAWFRQGVFL